MYKVIAIGLFVVAGVLFLVGIYGVYTGVVSVLTGGFADNLILGLFFTLTFPVISLVAGGCILQLGKGKGSG